MASPEVDTKSLVSRSIVKVVTIQKDALEGIVLVFDAKSQLLALETSSGVHVLPAASLHSIDVVKKPPSSKAEQDELFDMGGGLNRADLERAEEKAVQARKLEASKIGQGVTREGQTLFDELDRTFGCHWDKTTIVVSRKVRIEPPYDQTSCTGSDEAAVRRVKRVLGQIRKKL